MPIWPFRRKQPDPSTGTEEVMSILDPSEVESLGGLPVEAIAGVFRGDTSTIDTFRPNPRFVEYMHWVIRTAGPCDSGLQAAAREQGDGFVYIIDLRTPDGPQGRVPLEDIIGAFQVRNGQIVSDSYEASEHHQVLTSNGLVCLPPSLLEAFVQHLPKVE